MKDSTITIRLSEQEKEQLKAFADARDIPLSQVIREACRKYLQQEEK